MLEQIRLRDVQVAELRGRSNERLKTATRDGDKSDQPVRTEPGAAEEFGNSFGPVGRANHPVLRFFERPHDVCQKLPRIDPALARNLAVRVLRAVWVERLQAAVGKRHVGRAEALSDRLRQRVLYDDTL